MRIVPCMVSLSLTLAVMSEAPILAAEPTPDHERVVARESGYLIQPGDILAARVEPLLPFPTARVAGACNASQPLIATSEGSAPTRGFPIAVDSDGRASLPLIPPMKLAGLTIFQAEQKVAATYRDQGIIRDKLDPPAFALFRSARD